jgi:hypothetical protein
MINLFPGKRVKVYDHSRSGFFRGTVIRRYGKRSQYNSEWIYPDLIDVIFDGQTKISKGHFTPYTFGVGEK